MNHSIVLLQTHLHDIHEELGIEVDDRHAAAGGRPCERPICLLPATVPTLQAAHSFFMNSSARVCKALVMSSHKALRTTQYIRNQSAGIDITSVAT